MSPPKLLLYVDADVVACACAATAAGARDEPAGHAGRPVARQLRDDARQSERIAGARHLQPLERLLSVPSQEERTR